MSKITDEIADEINLETHAYAIENILILIMLVAAIALQIRRHKYGKGKGPLLLRLMDQLPEGAMPWPIAAIDSLFSRE